MLCGFGFNPTAPKNVRVEGVTDRTVLFIARVTGIINGELLAPGADTVTDPG
jgi:hypothetical protein